MKLEQLLAIRFLVSRKGRREKIISSTSGIAVVGMTFGVAALLIALSIISGFQREYQKALLSFNAHVIVIRSEEISDVEAEIGKLKRFESFGAMKGWTPFIYREGMVIANSKVHGVVMKGVDLAQYTNLSQMKIVLNSKDENIDRLPTLIVGKTLSEEMGGMKGEVQLLFPQGILPESVGTKNIQRFYVMGTFESGLHEYDSSFAFLSMHEAQNFFQMGDKVSGIEVWLHNPEDAFAWVTAMADEFSYPYAVFSWRDLNENLFKALELEKLVFFLLLLILVCVATLNILGTLSMFMLQKRQEIAILRALGAPWNKLRRIFLLDGLLVGLVGIGLGICLGSGILLILQVWQPITLAPEIYFIKTVPVFYSWANVLWVVGSSLFVVLLGCELTLRGMSKIRILPSLLEA